MPWGYAIVAGGALLSGKLASDATKKQSKIQADAISKGGDIDQAARSKAISQVLEIYSPSLAEFNQSMQGSIDLFNQGRVSTGDLLTQSAQNVSQIATQGGQSALNAMLGLPSPETVSTAQQPTTGPQQQVGPPTNITSTGQDLGQPQIPADPQVDGTFAQGQSQGIGNQFNIQPDGTVRPGTQQGFNYPAPGGGPTDQGIGQLSGGINRPTAQQLADTISNDPYNVNPNQVDSSVFQPQTPLEGEFIPREYDFQQQQVTMPGGTGAGLLGAEEAIRAGAGMGRQDLATGAVGALESLGTQTGIARGDIGQGRDFALNKISQAIQSGRGGTQAGIGAINQGVDRAVGFLNPYMSAGQEALNPYMALSGARGQGAFDEALINDPAYNLALQESERALSRNAGVTGGIGSGNTKGRFQLNAQQQAAANIDRQLGRYLPIISGGQQAAGQAGGFTTQGGFQSGQMAQRGGEFEASLQTRMGDVGIQSSQQLASLAQQLGMSEAQVLQSLGANLSNIDVGTGQAIGGMRETAGINAANILQGTTNQQIGIEQGLSQNLANLDQTTLNNIINSMQSGAGTNLQSQQQLAQILANLGVGAGSAANQTAIGIGQAQASGVTNPIGNAINTGIGLYASGAFNQQPQAQQPPPQQNMNLNYSQTPIPAMTGPYGINSPLPPIR